MPNQPTGESPKENTLLRDSLAAERTALANERTFLAYVRTALSLVIAGTFLVKFVDSVAAEIAGWALMPAGVLMFGFGIRRFQQVRGRLKQDAGAEFKSQECAKGSVEGGKAATHSDNER